MAHTLETRKKANEKVQQRRLDWIEENGPCSCGSTENLEVDHVDPSKKELEPSHIWTRRKEVQEKELAKCQVLCYECHNQKTIAERSTATHGMQSMYSKKKCRCVECKRAHSIHNAKYR